MFIHVCISLIYGVSVQTFMVPYVLLHTSIPSIHIFFGKFINVFILFNVYTYMFKYVILVLYFCKHVFLTLNILVHKCIFHQCIGTNVYPLLTLIY